LNRLNRLILPCLALCAGTSFAADTLFDDKVLVKGEGFEIKQSHLDVAYLQQKARFAAAGRNIPDSARARVEKETMDMLILKNLLLQRASPEDRSEAGRIIEAKLKDASSGVLSSQARLLGLTEEALKQEMTDQQISVIVMDREIKPKVVVTDEMCRKFYNENLPSFEMPEMVRAAHVLLATRNESGPLPEAQIKEKRATADKVLERARKGEDFGALAKEFSEDPGSKDNDGEYTFPRGQMDKQFETVAFSQGAGQISDIVTTTFGYHIIKTLEKIAPRVQEYSEAETRIKAFLTGQELDKLLKQQLETARQDSKLQILDDRFKS
jgi:parvulin-like peptidyl-prolyl isomerase